MSKSVLVVDDDEQLRDSLASFLSKHGYIVYTKQNGQECLDFMKNITPNVVVIDCFMPKMDGLTTIKILQNQQNKTPIIMMSSDQISSNGFVFLRKPFKMNELITLIDNLAKIKIH